MQPTLELVVGPMFAGKSTELIRRMKRMRAARHPYLLLTHSSDARYFGEEQVMGTHDRERFPARKVLDLGEVTDDELAAVDTVVVDEGQFFQHLAAHVWRWFSAPLRKNVIVAALNGTFRREPFASVSPLYALVTRVHLLSAICARCGNDAPYSKRLNERDNDAVIAVGGGECYEARCAACFDA